MARKKRAVVFMFDGVLVDSWRLHEHAWRTVLKRHGAKLDDEVVRRTIGRSSLPTAELLVKECRLSVTPRQLAEEKDEWFVDKATKELSGMSGIGQALESLKSDFLLGVVSVRNKVLVDQTLERLNLRRYFTSVSTIDDAKSGSAMEDLLAMSAKALEVKPERCVLVEDARLGVIAAKRAKMKVIAFDSNPKHDPDYSGADSEISSLHELVPELVSSVLTGS